ncbi:hypothetical protein KJ865_03020, partial [Myxococcota bacterium]|nr:hypothetical protein [Myxococcota bacterium]
MFINHHNFAYIIVLSLALAILPSCKKKENKRIVTVTWLKQNPKTHVWEGQKTTRPAHVTQVWNILHRIKMNPLRKLPPKEKMPPKTQAILFHRGSGSIAVVAEVFGDRFLLVDGKYYHAQQLI